MALNREDVVLVGRLMGMGREETCTLHAERVSLPGIVVSHFSKCNVHHAPCDLPDGEYRVVFEGGMMPFQKRHGAWQALGS
jgi:hypothetical protein